MMKNAFYFTLKALSVRLCIKPGIQKRETECGERGDGGMSTNISGNVLKHFGECPQTFIHLRKQNTLYISKIKFGNGQRGHILVVSALKLFPF